MNIRGMTNYLSCPSGTLDWNRKSIINLTTMIIKVKIIFRTFSTPEIKFPDIDFSYQFSHFNDVRPSWGYQTFNGDAFTFLTSINSSLASQIAFPATRRISLSPLTSFFSDSSTWNFSTGNYRWCRHHFLLLYIISFKFKEKNKNHVSCEISSLVNQKVSSQQYVDSVKI